MTRLLSRMLLLCASVLLLGSGPGAGAKRGPGAAALSGSKRAGADREPKGEERSVATGARAMRGNMFLKRGSNRAALVSFERQLEETPDAPGVHLGLAKALARIGRCAEALDHFWPYIGTVPFGGDSALAASTCSTRVGLLEDAIYFDRLAVELSPESARAWTNLALDLSTAGDAVGLEDTLDALLNLRDDRDASMYARAVIALRDGDLDTFDQVAFVWEAADGPSLDLRRLQAQSWLDTDNPTLALDSLKNVRRIKNGQQVRHLRAEALRRTGYPEEAASYLEDRPESVVEGTNADAVRVRLDVDTGDFAAAHALLDSYEGRLDADLTASAWYLARREGRTAALPALVERYRRVQSNPMRTLAQLIPWTEPLDP